MDPIYFITLSISILCFGIFICLLLYHNKYNRLLKKFNKLKNEYREYKKMYDFSPGSKALVIDWGLEWSKDKKPFFVNYETDVLEKAGNKIKVSAYNYTSLDNLANDPSSRASIMSHMQNTWVDISKCRLIITDIDSKMAKFRDLKIETIINS